MKMDETLGQYLRRKRESHLLSIKDASRSTGIDSYVIAALEENSFDTISPPELVSQYLEKYSAFLQLKKKDILRRYCMQVGETDKEKQVFPQLSLFSEENPSFRPMRKRRHLPEKRVIEAVAWVIIVAVLSGSIFFFVSHIFFMKADPHKRQKPIESIEDKQNVGTKISSAVELPQHDQNQVKESSRTADMPKRNTLSDAASSSSMKKVRVVGNSDSKRYHLPGMKYFDKIKSHHKVVFHSEAEAVKAGYSKARE
jgi:cytoskeletal protein RodZ